MISKFVDWLLSPLTRRVAQAVEGIMQENKQAVCQLRKEVHEIHRNTYRIAKSTEPIL